jgi:hypothetical protein
LDQWKRHNSSTGGYFKCNRYEAVKVVTEKVHKAQNEVKNLIYKVVTEKVQCKAQNEVTNLIYKVVTEKVHKVQKEVKNLIYKVVTDTQGSE